MDDYILKVKNLSVSFGGDKIIDDLNFDLKNKENLIIVGPNGAGKSILLKALLGIIPFSGEIKWREGLKVSYFPQNFFPAKELPLSVKEFFKFKKAPQNKIKESLKAVGLDDISVLNKKIGFLSAGQFQRMMIAWSLVDEPHVLLFDEPTSGIDIGGEETIYNLLSEIEKKINLTMILITHDLNIVYKFADNVLCLNKKAICYGAPQSALSSESFHKLYGGEMKFYQHKHD